ncbi:MAG: serpin family protein [Muribaculaceae bacterium]|nr:serpin family protein [Muribaculaceae bacterium]
MNRFTFRFLLGITVFAGLMTGCSNDDETIYPKPTPKPVEEPFVLKDRQDIALNSTQKEGIAMQNDFAFRLFNEDMTSTDNNSLISPLSITQCLSMAANGASEEVRNEIVDNLLPGGGSLEELNSLNKYLVESLVDVDNSSILTLANSAWVDKNFKILSPFAENIKEYYNAESSALDFSASNAVNKINEWVDKSTNGLIPTLFQAIPQDYVFILINAMYFNGAWFEPFEKNNTEKAVFHNEDGKAVEVEFMNNNSRFSYIISSAYSAVQLPYGNKAFSFYAVMPTEGQSFDMTEEKWNTIKAEMNSGDLVISMPKFETQYDVSEISEKMKTAGIAKLFNTSGALRNTVSPPLPESYVKMIHKTVFKVDEIGAEGAGLTGLGMEFLGPDGGETPKTPEIILNRPFIYIVEEQSTGAILFIGAVRNL